MDSLFRESASEEQSRRVRESLPATFSSAATARALRQRQARQRALDLDGTFSREEVRRRSVVDSDEDDNERRIRRSSDRRRSHGRGRSTNRPRSTTRRRSRRDYIPESVDDVAALSSRPLFDQIGSNEPFFPNGILLTIIPFLVIVAGALTCASISSQWPHSRQPGCSPGLMRLSDILGISDLCQPDPSNTTRIRFIDALQNKTSLADLNSPSKARLLWSNYAQKEEERPTTDESALCAAASLWLFEKEYHPIARTDYLDALHESAEQYFASWPHRGLRGLNSSLTHTLDLDRQGQGRIDFMYIYRIMLERQLSQYENSSKDYNTETFWNSITPGKNFPTPLKAMLRSLHSQALEDHAQFLTHLQQSREVESDIDTAISHREAFHDIFRANWKIWATHCPPGGPVTDYEKTPHIPMDSGLSTYDRGFCFMFWPEGVRVRMLNGAIHSYHDSAKQYARMATAVFEDLQTYSGMVVGMIEKATKVKQGVGHEEFILLVKRILEEVDVTERWLRGIL